MLIDLQTKTFVLKKLSKTEVNEGMCYSNKKMHDVSHSIPAL